MKKFFAVILALALCLTAFCGMSAMAAESVSYVQVTDLEEVKAGGEYVIIAYHAADDAYYALDSFTDDAAKIDSTKMFNKEVSVADGVATITGGDMPVWTIAAEGEGISLHKADVGYVGWNGEKKTECVANPFAWQIAAGENGIFRITNGGGTYVLGYRDNNPNFRFGPWPSSKEGDETYSFDLMLFKATTAGSGATPAPNPGPSIDDTADINTLPLYAVLAMGVAVVTFASKKRFAK